MNDSPFITPPEGGLDLYIDKIVVRGGGPVSAARVAMAVEQALQQAFTGGDGVQGHVAAQSDSVRRVRSRVPRAAVADADGIAGAIRAAVAGYIGGPAKGPAR